MKLIADWRRVLSRSLSFWMQVVGLLVLIVPEVWFAMTGQDYDPYAAWWLGVILLVAGLGGRLVRQEARLWKELLRIGGVALVAIMLAVLLATSVHAAPATQAETLDIAVPFIAQEEGESLVSYRDIVGVPTICFGATDGVEMGMRMTHQECVDLLWAEVAQYRDRLHAYFTPRTISDRLPPTRDAAYTSLAYNCGVAGIGRSTATRRLNSGDVAGGCQALTWWNKAGGRVIRGLVNRRKREQVLCMAGV